MMRKLSILPEYAKQYLNCTTSERDRQLVYQLHDWLNRHQVSLVNFTSENREQFLKKPANRALAPSSRRNYSVTLQKYLTYLYSAGHTTYYCRQRTRKKPTTRNAPEVAPEMPSCALSYLANNPSKSLQSHITTFHQWLDRKQLDTNRLTTELIDRFLDKPHSRRVAPACRRAYRNHLLPYLSYLHKFNLLPFKPEHTHLDPKFLPPSSREFLSELSITLKPGTINSYAHTLRVFYNHFLQHSASIYDLERTEVIPWLRELKERKLHPATRSSMAGNIRVYLRWLYDRDKLRQHPDDLIRSEDFPKLPDYLPRPLEPDVDKKLQTLLFAQKQSQLYAKGLWLMRKAGLRIGELESLELDCLRHDPQGNVFLKVPIGKLNNERLVPLAPEAVQLVTEFQQRSPAARKYLFSEFLTTKSSRARFYDQLKRASKKLNAVPIQSHQLRHTCATELINSGMSLPSLMNFLGHKDYRMTLRYAKITQQTVIEEFNRSLQCSKKRYHNALNSQPTQSIDGLILLANLIKWCHSQDKPKHIDRIIKRLHRLKPAIATLKKRKQQTETGDN